MLGYHFRGETYIYLCLICGADPYRKYGSRDQSEEMGVPLLIITFNIIIIILWLLGNSCIATLVREEDIPLPEEKTETATLSSQAPFTLSQENIDHNVGWGD